MTTNLNNVTTEQLIDYENLELDDPNACFKPHENLSLLDAAALQTNNSTLNNTSNNNNHNMLSSLPALGQQDNRLTFAGIHTTGFKDLLLKPELMKAIEDCAFEHPSQVQQECIPPSIIGVDILCQAKSGMGKTAVFVLNTLHQLDENPKPVSVLVMCHTRELAYQIKKEYDRFAKHFSEEQKVTVGVFYGGQPISEHIKLLKEEKTTPTVIVGTPGRILALVRGKHLNLEHVKHFVLDECDKMLEAVDMRSDVQHIFKQTNPQKQTQMYSATMKQEVRLICKKFMKQPFELTIDNETGLTLHGLQQFYSKLQENEKNRKLVNMIDALSFNQVIIFVKSTARADALTKLLQKNSFPASAIHSGLSQSQRIEKFQQFKAFKLRIMVATDVLGRGIDVERVNIVVNYDMPDNSDQYLHRVGRAGRFGTKGLAVSFIATEEDETVLKDTQRRFEVKISDMPDTINESSYMNN